MLYAYRQEVSIKPSTLANKSFKLYAQYGSEGVIVNWDFCKTVERNQIG